jgi:hypothetical protein
MDYYQQFAPSSYDPAGMSLEPSVAASHKEFVEDSYVSTSGANSTDTLRDDDSPPNKRWGLRQVDYTSANGEDVTNRVVPTEYPLQLEHASTSSIVL